jgi:hypothetical protein
MILNQESLSNALSLAITTRETWFDVATGAVVDVSDMNYIGPAVMCNNCDMLYLTARPEAGGLAYLFAGTDMEQLLLALTGER